MAPPASLDLALDLEIGHRQAHISLTSTLENLT